MNNRQSRAPYALALLLSGVVGAGNATPVHAQTTADVVVSETSTASGITLDANRVYEISDGVVYSLTGPISGNFTLTKIGAGTLNLKGSENAALIVQEGKATLSTEGSTPVFTNGVTVLSGATLELTKKDSLGYLQTDGKSQQIYLYGGTMDKNGSDYLNETLGYVDVHMKGGTLKATNGFYDILRPQTRILVEAEDDATADNPTVSTISTRLNVRTNYMTSTDGAIIDVAENAQLNLTGYVDGGSASQIGLIKTGEGTLKLSGGVCSGNIILRDGTTVFSWTGNGRRWNGNIYVEDGAILRTNKDGLGYGVDSGKTNIYLAGELNASGENESLRNVNFYLQGGKITGSRLDFLSSSDVFRAMVRDGATAENPTVSTVSNDLVFREHLRGTSGITFTVDENALLKLDGAISTWMSSSDSTAIHKNGAGKLVVSNASNALNIFDVYVDEGAIEIQNNALKTAKSLTLAEGTLFDQTGGSLTISKLNFGGYDELLLNADLSTDYSTISGNVDFLPNATFSLSTDANLSLDDFLNSEIILMASDHEFSGIENVGLDLNDLSIELPAGYSWSLSQLSVDGKYLLATGVQAPEPASWLLALCGLAGICGLRAFNKHGKKRVAA